MHCPCAGSGGKLSHTCILPNSSRHGAAPTGTQGFPMLNLPTKSAIKQDLSERPQPSQQHWWHGKRGAGRPLDSCPSIPISPLPPRRQPHPPHPTHDARHEAVHVLTRSCRRTGAFLPRYVGKKSTMSQNKFFLNFFYSTHTNNFLCAGLAPSDYYTSNPYTQYSNYPTTVSYSNYGAPSPGGLLTK